jgi:hypothetical protein
LFLADWLGNDVCMINHGCALESSDQDKLGVLRRLDQFRKWESLDDKRCCLGCQQLITGRQIEVTGGTPDSGSLRLNCPSEGCQSIPMDWVLPTAEMLAKLRKRKELPHHNGRDGHSFGTRENSIAAFLRKRAAALKRSHVHWPSPP